MPVNNFSQEEIARLLRQQHGVPDDKARTAAELNAGDRLGVCAIHGAGKMPCRECTAYMVKEHGHKFRLHDVEPAAPAPKPMEPLVLCSRLGEGLFILLTLPPRTKKNGTTLGVRQKASYRHYRDAIIDRLAPFVAQLGNPVLPDREHGYNIRAIYTVDAKGRLADKVGLDQGLYDALENAGVVSDDWQFRTADGTRVVLDDVTHPRVEILITPLP